MNLLFRIILIVFCIFAAILQYSFLPHFSISSQWPNLALIIVCLIELKRSSKTSTETAVFLGLVSDAFSSLPFGVFTVSFLISALLLKQIYYLMQESVLAKIVSFVVIFASFTVIKLFIYSILSISLPDANYMLFYQFLISLIYNTIIFTALSFAFKAMKRSPRESYGYI